MMGRFPGEEPKFYGAITVSERGQVVIPAEARRDLDISPNTKLLVLRGPGEALILVKSDSVVAFLTRAATRLSHLEQILKTDSAKNVQGEPPED